MSEQQNSENRKGWYSKQLSAVVYQQKFAENDFEMYMQHWRYKEQVTGQQANRSSVNLCSNKLKAKEMKEKQTFRKDTLQFIQRVINNRSLHFLSNKKSMQQIRQNLICT